MPAHRKDQARVLPLVESDSDPRFYTIKYKDGRSPVYRIVAVLADGTKAAQNFQTPKEALSARVGLERSMQQHALLSARKAIDLFIATRVKPSGLKEASVVTKLGRLVAFFEPMLDQPVVRLTGDRGAALYAGKVGAELGPDGKPKLLEAGYIHRVTKKTGRPPAVDTHQNTLKVAKEFSAWLLQQGFVAKDPLAGVEPIGRRREGGFGKSDLSFEEILRLDQTCEQVLATLHQRPDHQQLPWRQRAVAVIMAMRMGLRTNELLSARRRQVAIIRRGEAGSEPTAFFEVTRESAKTGTSVRRLPIPPSVLKHLVPLLPPGLEQFIFAGAPRGRMGGLGGRNWERDPNTRLTERWLANALARLCKLAGVRVENPHGLRGAFKDLASKGGAAVEAASAALGHGGGQVGERHYSNEQVLAEASQKRVLEQLGYTSEDISQKGTN